MKYVYNFHLKKQTKKKILNSVNPYIYFKSLKHQYLNLMFRKNWSVSKCNGKLYIFSKIYNVV